MVKRAGESPKRKGKRSRTVNLVPAVVDALQHAEALPADLRTVFGQALASILEENKEDRHAYEHEVVTEAEKAFGTVLSAMDQLHVAALEKQNEVISPAEHAKRTKAKKDAEADLEAAGKKLEASKEAQANCRKAVDDAKSHLKAVQKESTAADKEMQAHANKKANLSDLLANEFVALQQETSNTPTGKTAVKKLLHAGKEYDLDETLLTTFPLTCKKEPASRSDFELMMFTSLKASIDKQIESLTQKVAELEPSKGQLTNTATAAQQSLERAQASLTAANEEHSGAHAAHKEADKAVTKAEDGRYQIWADMKLACDAQDDLADEITAFKETVQSFQQLRDREPEPEPAEEPEPPEEAEQEEVAAPDAAMEAAAEE